MTRTPSIVHILAAIVLLASSAQALPTLKSTWKGIKGAVKSRNGVVSRPAWRNRAPSLDSLRDQVGTVPVPASLRANGLSANRGLGQIVGAGPSQAAIEARRAEITRAEQFNESIVANNRARRIATESPYARFPAPNSGHAANPGVSRKVRNKLAPSNINTGLAPLGQNALRRGLMQ